MEKPIHREIRGMVMSMVFIVGLFWASADCLFTALVFWEIREKMKPDTAEITGSRKRAKPPLTVQYLS